MSTDLSVGTVDTISHCSPDLPNSVVVANAADSPEDENLMGSATDGCPSPIDVGRDPDLWLYRERTVALLKRYLRLSIEVGRLPSLLGRELFRSKVTSYRMATFEDAVIFVHDVERILEQLDALSKDLVALIIFQDYSQEAAAVVLQCGRRTVNRQFPETIDAISELFLEGGLLNRLPVRRPVENSCQEGERAQFSPSACK
jgi:hypothetical protein